MTDDQLENGPESVDAKLARLGQGTASLRAPPGFAERVLAAVDAEATAGWISVAASAARRVVALAAIAAAVAAFFATHDEERVNEAVAVSFGEVEVEW